MAGVARRSFADIFQAAASTIWQMPMVARFRGGVTAAFGAALAISLATYNAADPSLNAASATPPTNALGGGGAVLADLFFQSLGLTSWLAAVLLVVFGLSRVANPDPNASRRDLRKSAFFSTSGLLLLAGGMAALPRPAAWPLAEGLGGLWGDGLTGLIASLLSFARIPGAVAITGVILTIAGLAVLVVALGLQHLRVDGLGAWLSSHLRRSSKQPAPATQTGKRAPAVRRPKPSATPVAMPGDMPRDMDDDVLPDAPLNADGEAALAIRAPKSAPRDSGREVREAQKTFDFVQPGGFRLPELAMLAKPKPRSSQFDEASLRQNARLLESVLAEFGVRGQIDQIRPGPVVTLYELVPAPGVKSARVVALSDDIARSMSVMLACRVSRGARPQRHRHRAAQRLPRDCLSARPAGLALITRRSTQALPMALGETIGGEPYIADLARMPHLLIAGTTGSGKSVGVNAMILSILYRLSPEQCRFIMIDPKMLELSSMTASRIC